MKSELWKQINVDCPECDRTTFCDVARPKHLTDLLEPSDDDREHAEKVGAIFKCFNCNKKSLVTYIPISIQLFNNRGEVDLF